jgi:hypothetical protein
MTTQPRLRLNSLPAPLGLAVLGDRDEIRVPGLTAWYRQVVSCRFSVNAPHFRLITDDRDRKLL